MYVCNSLILSFMYDLGGGLRYSILNRVPYGSVADPKLQPLLVRTSLACRPIFGAQAHGQLTMSSVNTGSVVLITGNARNSHQDGAATVSASLLLKQGKALLADEADICTTLERRVRVGAFPMARSNIADAASAAQAAITRMRSLEEKVEGVIQQLERFPPKQAVSNDLQQVLHELEAELTAIREDARFPDLPAARVLDAKDLKGLSTIELQGGKQHDGVPGNQCCCVQ